jgi:predicted DNA-binding transcriptional regulator AlpA
MTVSRALTYADLRELGITYSRAHLTRLENSGRFPRRFMFSARHTCWDEAEILKWLDEKRASAGRNPAVPRDPVTGHYMRQTTDTPPVIERRHQRATPVAATPVAATPVAIVRRSLPN